MLLALRIGKCLLDYFRKFVDPFDTHSSEFYRIVLNGECFSVRKCFLPGSEVYYKWDFVTALLCLLHDSKIN